MKRSSLKSIRTTFFAEMSQKLKCDAQDNEVMVNTILTVVVNNECWTHILGHLNGEDSLNDMTRGTRIGFILWSKGYLSSSHRHQIMYVKTNLIYDQHI